MAPTAPVPRATAVPLELRPPFFSARGPAALVSAPNRFAPAAHAGPSEELRPGRSTRPRAGHVPVLRNKSALWLALVVSAGTFLAACKHDTPDPVVPEEPTTIVVVNAADMKGWVKHVMGTPPATVALVASPATPLRGTGSVRYTTAANHNHSFTFARVRNTQYGGTLLADITKLTYSTYGERRDTTTDTPFMVLHVDITGDGVPDDIVNFTPWYQTGRFLVPGALNQWVNKTGAWQTWDAFHGAWWVVLVDITTDPDHNGKQFTLADYIRLHPTATIQNLANGLGGIRVGVGGPPFGNNFVGYADNITIGVKGVNTTYDFEN